MVRAPPPPVLRGVRVARQAADRRVRRRRHDVGKAELDAVQSRQLQRWEGLSTSEKMKDFARRHQYGLILGGWALSVGASFAVIARNKYQTTPQKVRAGHRRRGAQHG